MSAPCPAPDSGAGIAVRLSDYLDCQARALGENGFQLIAGGPLGMSVLSALLTLFVAFIGFRLILGETPDVRDGIGWTLRLGFVLALATSWPVFQVLIFRVAVDGPTELANILLPATGLSSDGFAWRVQQAYDAIRLGPTTQLAWTSLPVVGPVSALPPPVPIQSPMPNTATLFVLSAAGFTAALRIAAGFLLAIGPLAIMALLFDATLGIFIGWVRALAGMALSTVAAIIVSTIGLTIVEGELAHLQSVRVTGPTQSFDLQALPTIVVLFALVMLVTVVSAMRMTNAFRLAHPRPSRASRFDRPAQPFLRPAATALHPAWEQAVARTHPATQGRGRVAAVAEALTATVRREQAHLIEASAPSGFPRHDSVEATAAATAGGAGTGQGTVDRRGVSRRTRTAVRRDQIE